MNISCDIAMDLIALYMDGVASEESRGAIREHLKGCPKCKRAFATYSTNIREAQKPSHMATQDDISVKYTKLAKNLRRNHLISTATVIAIVTISIGIGSFGTMKLLYGRPAVDDIE